MIVGFPPGARSPSAIYSNGFEEPVDVTTDSRGNVYGADDALSSINEYSQGINKMLESCAAGTVLESISVDANGDVFAAYNAPERSGTGHLIEYRGGLKGCRPISLMSLPAYISGMALDNRGNLVVCANSSVDIIEPPYRRISRRLGSGYKLPLSVRIKKGGDEAYISYSGLGEVLILTYPTGTVVKTLGSKQGLLSVQGAVDSQNFDP